MTKPAKPAARGTGSTAWLMEAVRAHQAGDLRRAEDLYRRVLSKTPQQPDALHLLGVIAHQRGDHERAVSLIDQAVAVQDRDPAFHNNRGSALLALHRFGEAEQAFRRALRQNPTYPEALNNLGNALQEQGELDASVDFYERAIAARPAYAEAFSNLGRARRTQGDLAGAEASFRQALALRPTYAKALTGLADTVAEQGRPDESEGLYAAALRADPRDAEALAARAALRERASDLQGALSDANAALSIDPKSVRALLVAARSERRLGDAEAALARIASLSSDPGDPETRAFIAFEKATACDRLARYREAAVAFADANSQLLNSPQGRRVDRDAFPRAIADLSQRFTAPWLDSWSPTEAAERSPAFLVGFPRSGTTLLDQVLDAHPQLATIEEKPLIDTVKAALIERHGPYPECLAPLTPSQIAPLRERYWTLAEAARAAHGDALIVDKMPLNIIDIGLIWRLFPDAKIILALRHPCDVVLSGFMQAFRPNEAMVHFSAIGATARLYGAVMALWLQYRSLLPIATESVRYEDLVLDFEGETRRILAFLDVPWDEAVRGYRDHARSRTISTPSYHQVVQPLYTRSIGRWRNYEPEMRDVLPILEPFISAFGYEDGEAE